MDTLQGYQNTKYIESISETVPPLSLSRSNGWLVPKIIPGSNEIDLSATNPFIICQNPDSLIHDFESLSDKYVALTVITNPIYEISKEIWSSYFKDLFVPFKSHYLVEIEKYQFERTVSQHHRYYSRKALKEAAITLAEKPIDYLDDFYYLYQQLLVRHDVCASNALSKKMLAQQFNVPGVKMFVARDDYGIQAISVWMQTQDVAFYHLAVSSETGYKKSFAYGTMKTAIDHFFGEGTRMLGLGGGNSIRTKNKIAVNSGLQSFKAGWATLSTDVFLCGRILNPEIYNALTKSAVKTDSQFFPLYRG